jgi:hypothetical protein
MRYLEGINLSGNDAVIHVRRVTIFGNEYWEHYFGSGTVWHEIHTGWRPGAYLEGRMANYWAVEKRKAENRYGRNRTLARSTPDGRSFASSGSGESSCSGGNHRAGRE